MRTLRFPSGKLSQGRGDVAEAVIGCLSNDSWDVWIISHGLSQFVERYLNADAISIATTSSFIPWALTIAPRFFCVFVC